MDQLTQDGSTTITKQEFLALFPHLSFPVQVPYADHGWFVVAPAPQPTYDPATQQLVEGKPVFDAGCNHWLQTWEVK